MYRQTDWEIWPDTCTDNWVLHNLLPTYMKTQDNTDSFYFIIMKWIHILPPRSTSNPTNSTLHMYVYYDRAASCSTHRALKYCIYYFTYVCTYVHTLYSRVSIMATSGLWVSVAMAWVSRGEVLQGACWGGMLRGHVVHIRTHSYVTSYVTTHAHIHAHTHPLTYIIHTQIHAHAHTYLLRSFM